MLFFINIICFLRTENTFFCIITTDHVILVFLLPLKIQCRIHVSNTGKKGVVEERKENLVNDTIWFISLE